MCMCRIEEYELFCVLMTRTWFFVAFCRLMKNNCLYRRVSNLGDNREIASVKQRYWDARAWYTGDFRVYLDVYHWTFNLQNLPNEPEFYIQTLSWGTYDQIYLEIMHVKSITYGKKEKWILLKGNGMVALCH